RCTDLPGRARSPAHREDQREHPRSLKARLHPRRRPRRERAGSCLMLRRPPLRAIPLWIILLLYWGFLFYSTHEPVVTIPFQATDKTAHYLAYGALGGLLYLALWANNPRRSDLVFLVLV